MFCKYANQGTGRLNSTNREESINQSASVLAQHFMTAYKTDRQASYEMENKKGAFRQHWNSTQCWLCSRHSQEYKICSEAKALLARILHTWLVQDILIWLALDKIDCLESTPCGMNTLNGRAITICQSEAPHKSPMMLQIEIDRSSKAQTLEDVVCCKMFTCTKPLPKKWRSGIKLSTL